MSTPVRRAEMARIEGELSNLLDEQTRTVDEGRAEALAVRVGQLLRRQEQLLQPMSIDDDDDNGHLNAPRAVERPNRRVENSAKRPRVDEDLPIDVAVPDTIYVAEALLSSQSFEERLVERTEQSVSWQRLPIAFQIPSPSVISLLNDWATFEMRGIVYNYLFFGYQSTMRLESAWWRLVFCDNSHKRTTLAVGRSSGIRWQQHANGTDWSVHKLGFRATGNGDDIMFNAPRVENSPLLNRSFEFQDNGNLCSMHALNNVARSIVLTPPTFYETIYDIADPFPTDLSPQFDDLAWFRLRVNTGGTESELATAALRRGVILARVVIRNIFDIESLLGDSLLGKMAQRNGGAILLAPRGGHYVPLVPDSAGDWAVINDRAPFIRQQSLTRRSFGAVVRAYYLAKLSVYQLDGDDHEKTAVRLRSNARDANNTELRVLVPLHFVPNLSEASNDLDRLAHYWTRYVLNNTTATTDNVNPPETDLVLAFNYTQTRMLRLDAPCQAEFVHSPKNPFTMLMAKTYIELELNAVADVMAGLLLASDVVRPAAFVAPVTDARRILLSERALGLLLDSAQRSCAPLTNREWLRLMALHVVVANELVSHATWPILFLLMNVLFTDHRDDSGDVEGRYPNIVGVWRQLQRQLVGAQVTEIEKYLPKPTNNDLLPHEYAIRLTIFTLPIDVSTLDYFQYNVLRTRSFDRSLWLLSSYNAFLVQAGRPDNGVSRRMLRYLQPAERNARFKVELATSDDHRYVSQLRRLFFVSTVAGPFGADEAGDIVHRLVQPRQAEMAAPEFFELFDVIAAPRYLLVEQEHGVGIPFIPWKMTAEVDAREKGKPQLLLRIFTIMDQLYGTFYDRRNEQVHVDAVDLRSSLTSRYRGGRGLLPSAEPIIAHEELAARVK
jgi:hypothetical protein